jgi:D-3-phosphoglycerate dehydrogenase
MPDVLVSAPYLLPEVERFRPVFDRADVRLHLAKVRERLSEDELLVYAGEIDGAICGDDAFTARVLRAAAPRLRVLSKWGTGIDSIDLEEAAHLGVRVLNTPGAFTEAVADHVMGLVLAFARRIPWSDREVKSGGWEKTVCRSLAECTLGVVGVGAIGKAVLRRASAFGMTLLGNDIIEIDPDFTAGWGVRMVGLDELLSTSDFVSLNCDLNPTSLGLIGEAEFSRMQPTTVLINTSRGRIVEETSLLRALQSGSIAGAGLDVFAEEPLPGDSPLRTMGQVLLSAHNANSSPRARERVHRSTIDNLLLGLGIDPVAAWGARSTADPAAS